MPKFKILPGYSFKQPDGSTLQEGQTIELDDLAAKAHAGKVEPLPDDKDTVILPAEAGSNPA